MDPILFFPDGGNIGSLKGSLHVKEKYVADEFTEEEYALYGIEIYGS